MRRTPAKSLTVHPSHCTRRVSLANCLSSLRCLPRKGTVEPADDGFSTQSTRGEKSEANVNRGQSRVKGRAALISAAFLCAALVLGGWRGGLHSGAGTLLQSAQAIQHVLGHSGTGGPVEGGGPPGHQ